MTLDLDAQPLRAFRKAIRLHWDPYTLDFSQDVEDWPTLSALEQDAVRQLLALFLAGEEAVTHDLTPLLVALRRWDAPIEEELFLTSQLYEESKHVAFFDRWIAEVCGEYDTTEYYTPGYQQLFYEILPEHLSQLLDTPVPDEREALRKMARAVVTYHMTIEGVLAETGYYAFAQTLAERSLMPGLLDGVKTVQQDEARHVAFGVHLLQRFVRRDPSLLEEITGLQEELLPLPLNILQESLSRWPEPPFGIEIRDFTEYASRQFTKRSRAINREG